MVLFIINSVDEAKIKICDDSYDKLKAQANKTQFKTQNAQKTTKQAPMEKPNKEEEHAKLYASLRAALPEKEKTVTVFDPDNESVLYLRALADTRVFFEKTIDMKSMKEILKSAIEAEKDSIVFYLGMKDVVPESLGKSRIDHIIKEEMGHIRSLSKELIALK